MSGFVLGVRILLAAVFVVAGLAKLADREGSRRALENFAVPARLAAGGGVVLPLVEVSIAVCLLVGATAWLAVVAATGLLSVFVVAIGVTMARGAAPDCHCFGQLHSAPAGWRALARNGVLAAVGAVAIAYGPHASELSAVAWIGRLSATELAVGSAGLFLMALILAHAWFLLELLRQHGRILNRLETLEHVFAGAAQVVPGPTGGTAAQPVGAGNGNGHAAGLPAGMPAPEFDLPRLDGQNVSLSSLRARGAPVLLIFTDPGCGPCTALMPEIADRQRRLGDRLTIALVSRGGVERNLAKAREYGLSDVLVQDDREISSEYRALGTPIALLVSADGRIASPLAAGADAIKALVQNSTDGPLQVVRSAPNSKISDGAAPVPAPAGLAVGSEAPDLTWQDLDGHQVSLRALRAAPVVVLFWNPGCGFCQRMLPDLRAWETQRDHKAPHLLIVSTGDKESNRAMGLRSPIALEPGFVSGRVFGATGTPSAVRIDRSGRIAEPVAVGAPAVRLLVTGAASAAAVAVGDPPPNGRGTGASVAVAAGPPAIGEPAPDFTLSDLAGRTVRLSARRGRRLLVVFWDPACGFCQRMLPEVRSWEGSHTSRLPELVLVSSGGAEVNRAMGLSSSVLLDEAGATMGAFGASGTPMGMLIDREGRVASPLLAGADAVLAAARGDPGLAAVRS